MAPGLRGQVTVPLPAFHVHTGSALHATQDSFAHQLRPPDGMHVTTVLHWIDRVNDRFDETRDGPQRLEAAHFADRKGARFRGILRPS